MDKAGLAMVYKTAIGALYISFIHIQPQHSTQHSQSHHHHFIPTTPRSRGRQGGPMGGLPLPLLRTPRAGPSPRPRGVHGAAQGAPHGGPPRRAALLPRYAFVLFLNPSPSPNTTSHHLTKSSFHTNRRHARPKRHAGADCLQRLVLRFGRRGTCGRGPGVLPAPAGRGGAGAQGV
jgi:hypothetical protein